MGKPKKQKNIFKVIKNFSLPISLFLLLLILIFITFEQFITDKYHPQTFVGSTNISFLNQGQAIRKIQADFNNRTKQQLHFVYPQGSFNIDISTSSASLDYSSLETSFNIQKSGPLFWDKLQKQLQALVFGYKLNPKITLSLDKQTETIEKAVNKPPQDAQLFFDETTSLEGTPSARIQIKEGVNGLALDKQKLSNYVADFILTGKYQNQLPLTVDPPKITTDHVLKAKQALEKTLQEPIQLTFQSSNWVIDTKQLLALLDLESGQDTFLDKNKTNLYLQKIAQEIDQEVQEGLFEFNQQTKRVTAFKPSQEGRKLNLEQTYRLLTDTLTNNESKSINLPVDIIRPKIETSDVNSLGIKELLGSGVSNFTGSIANRIYNVNLTASKINGVLIPPGEVFSFNKTVGDISAATGFKQAYVIKEGRTVLDDGGGVCQDSTTLFRAVLNAGLPVVKRTAHAYRVGYYEQGFPPGLDATVFYPSVDFQFKNDTKAHILIQAYTQGTTLYIDLYGTPDGRAVSLTQPVVTGQTPPPPELRQDDPTLPKGTVKRVDWAAWGAKVIFKRTVKKGEEVLTDETWVSNYKPWQAVFLIGTL